MNSLPISHNFLCSVVLLSYVMWNNAFSADKQPIFKSSATTSVSESCQDVATERSQTDDQSLEHAEIATLCSICSGIPCANLACESNKSLYDVLKGATAALANLPEGEWRSRHELFRDLFD